MKSDLLQTWPVYVFQGTPVEKGGEALACPPSPVCAFLL